MFKRLYNLYAGLRIGRERRRICLLFEISYSGYLKEQKKILGSPNKHLYIPIEYKEDILENQRQRAEKYREAVKDVTWEDYVYRFDRYLYHKYKDK